MVQQSSPDSTEPIWHSISEKELLSELRTSHKGLAEIEAKSRLEKYGSNEIKDRRSASFWDILMRQFKNIFIYILLGVAVISFFVGEVIDFWVVLSIIAFTAAIGFIQDFRAERSMEALKNMTTKQATVRRNNTSKIIDARDLVPGDVMLLKVGDHVPTDGRVLEVTEFRVDESALTGESSPVSKEVSTLPDGTPLAERFNMIFTGSYVVTGRAVALVVKTGEETEIGKVAQLISGIRDEPTPIQRKLDQMSKRIAVAVILLCAFMFMLGVFKGTPLLSMLLIVAAVSVSGIPESLPAVVTVILAHGVKSMAKKNAIIKKMPAVETLGAATVICSDKTGTLTQNKMTVERIFVGGRHIEVTGEGYNPFGSFISGDVKVNPLKDPDLSKMLEIGILCNNSTLSLVDGEWRLFGMPTEGSLLVLSEKAKITTESVKAKSPRLREIPFDTSRKYMTSVNMTSKRCVVYTKGAPDVILHKCTHILRNNRIHAMDAKGRQELLDITTMYASQGLRTLALAYRNIPRSHLRGDVERNLVFVGIVGMKDPPRPGVQVSIKKCHEAGIKVIMITGDHKVTAKTVAQDLGIFAEGDSVLTGTELDELDEEQFLHYVEKTTVYARVTPHHKLRIVSALQKHGHIVAMTGDGVNDSPALKKADIGVAMGKSGTDVAREAAEMVLSDDDFTTIVKAIEEGRTIYSNIVKFIYYMLTGSIAEVIIIFISVMMGVALPLTALMILFVNLVTGDLPAMGLSLERPREHIMKQKPRPVKEGIINEFMMLRVAEFIPLITLGTISLFLWEIIVKSGTLDKARTMAFATLIFFELFHIFNARSGDKSIFDIGPFSNRYVNIGILGSIVLTLMAIYLPAGQEIFHTVPLHMVEWVAILIMASSVLFFVEVQKVVINMELKEKEKYMIRSMRE